MEEVKAKDILETYNRMFTPHISLEDVEFFLSTYAFFNVPVEFAAKLLYNSMNN